MQARFTAPSTRVLAQINTRVSVDYGASCWQDSTSVSINDQSVIYHSIYVTLECVAIGIRLGNKIMFLMRNMQRKHSKNPRGTYSFSIFNVVWVVVYLLPLPNLSIPIKHIYLVDSHWVNLYIYLGALLLVVDGELCWARDEFLSPSIAWTYMKWSLLILYKNKTQITNFEIRL